MGDWDWGWNIYEVQVSRHSCSLSSIPALLLTFSPSLSLLFSSVYSGHVYIAPSGVQKERMQPPDMFVVSPGDQTCVLSSPTNSAYTPSQCTPLFFNAYTLRNAAACIHTHSKWAVLATLLWQKEFTITHQEMIKGLRIGSTKENYKFYNTIRVPIIENTAEERDLTQRMKEAMVSQLCMHVCYS